MDGYSSAQGRVPMQGSPGKDFNRGGTGNSVPTATVFVAAGSTFCNRTLNFFKPDVQLFTTWTSTVDHFLIKNGHCLTTLCFSMLFEGFLVGCGRFRRTQILFFHDPRPTFSQPRLNFLPTAVQLFVAGRLIFESFLIIFGQ